MAAAVHAGDEAGLGDNDRGGLVYEGADGGRQHGRLCAAREDVAVEVAQDAEAGGFVDDRLLGGEAAICVHGEGVIARAEISEVLVPEPGEEGACFTDLG